MTFESIDNSRIVITNETRAVDYWIILTKDAVASIVDTLPQARGPLIWMSVYFPAISSSDNPRQQSDAAKREMHQAPIRWVPGIDMS